MVKHIWSWPCIALCAVYSYPPSSTYFCKGSWQTPLKITKALSALEAEQSPIYALLMAMLSRTRRGGKISWVSRQNVHRLRHGEQCRNDKLMINNTSGINTETKVNEQKLEAVTSFKYLGWVVNDEDSKPGILSRITQTTAALIRLKPVWNDRGISLSSKIDWCAPLSYPVSCMLVNHVSSQQSCKEEYKAWKWGATARYCFIPRLHSKTSYKDHVANKEVYAKIQQAIGPHEDLLTIVKRGKLQWYGHVFRSSGLVKIILQGTVKGGRRQGRHKKRREDTIRGWTGLEFAKYQKAVENRQMEETGCEVTVVPPTTLAVKG